MKIEKVNVGEKLSCFSDYWNPRIIGELNKNEFLIVPKGVEHKPVAEEEVSVMLFEPATTLNTGDKENDFTKENLDSI